MPSPHRRARAVTALVVVTLLAAACGRSAGGSAPEPRTDDGHYPVTVENCGHEVTIEAEPTDVVMLKSAIVPFLSSVGVLDHVSAKAGVYPEGYFSEAVLDEIGAIETLTDRVDTTGHVLVSTEAVLEHDPDLVLGRTENLSRSSLAELGIPSLEASGLCEEGRPDPGFQQVYDEVEMYGQVFNREAEAAAAVAQLKDRVAELTADVAPAGRTGAVLYPTVGGGSTYAYGNQSMADPLLAAAGIDNVFGGQDERIFEVALETLLEQDPDVLVLLHSDGDPKQVEQALTSLPGAGELSAVRDGRVHTELFNFVEPASPLTVDGLARLVAAVGDGS